MPKIATPPAPTLADELRQFLEAQGYSIADAADCAGMSRQSVWRIVSGNLPNPGYLTVRRIVEAVGGTVTIGGGGKIPRNPENP